jgi:acyl carrier protein
MKSEQEVLEILKEFLTQRLDVETADLHMETELESLGIDSLMQMELIFDFEDKFNFQMPEIEDRPTTVGALVMVIRANLPQASA